MGSIIKLLARVLSRFNALIMISITNQKAIEGIAFSIRKRFTIGTSASVDIVLDPVNFTKEKIVFLPIGFNGFGGPINIDIYSGITDNNDGTPVLAFNRSFVIGTPPQTEFRQNPTGVVITGLTPIELFLPSDGQGASSTGAETGEAIIADLDTTKKVLIRCTNTSGTAAATIGIKADFFEV